MAANGHFASIGDGRDEADHQHGVQVVDEEKEFKYVFFALVKFLRSPDLFTPVASTLFAG